MRLGRLTGDRAIAAVPILILVAGYSIVMTYLSYLRYTEFFATNWDMGIAMQMLWTNTHGFLLFETADYSQSGGMLKSYLQVHSTYVAVAVSVIYYMIPRATTLFAIQALGIALAALPLYYISRLVIGNRLLIYAVIGIFYTSFAVTAGVLYDFHWESFIPLEFFSAFYFLSRRLHIYAALAFIAGCLTLEVFPFLMMGMVLYFALDEFGASAVIIPRVFRYRRWRMLLIFFVASVAAYLLIRAAEFLLLPHLLGAPAGGAKSVGGSVSYLFLPSFSTSVFRFSLSYWSLIYLSLAFVPLLYPKHLVLGLPWFYQTFLLQPHFASHFGNQYGVIAVAVIFIGFIFGVGSVEKSPHDHLTGALLPAALAALTICGIAAAVAGPGPRKVLGSPLSSGATAISLLFISALVSALVLHLLPRFGWKLPGWRPILTAGRHSVKLRRLALVLIVITSILLNAAFSPVNPGNSNATPMPGYFINFSGNPAFDNMTLMTAGIPHDASIISSDNLFPFIANDPNAYSFLWYHPVPKNFYLPFNESNLPEFVLIDASQLADVMPLFQHALFHSSLYGLFRFEYASSYPGSIYLFKLGFSGKPSYYYSVPFHSNTYLTYRNLALGESGMIAGSPGSAFGSVIDSRNVPNATGDRTNIWYGPYVTLIPGRYMVTMNVRGYAFNNSSNVPLVYVDSSGYSTPVLYSGNIYSDELSAAGWRNITFTISISFPYPNIEFRGYLLYTAGAARGFVALNYIQVRALSA